MDKVEAKPNSRSLKMDEEKWLEDKNGNKCSVAYFGSEEKAQKALDNLDNCKDCSVINFKRLEHAYTKIFNQLIIKETYIFYVMGNTTPYQFATVL